MHLVLLLSILHKAITPRVPIRSEKTPDPPLPRELRGARAHQGGSVLVGGMAC